MKRDELRTDRLPSSLLGHEARSSSDDHAALRVWLRLLACTTDIETEIRRRLRSTFSVSLARFDYMAQLYRCPDGLKMGDLTQQLMVTGGSVTNLTDELERDGFVVRTSNPSDRRTWTVGLTGPGRKAFEAMAKEHEQWILELFGSLDERSLQNLHAELGRLRLHLSRIRRGPRSN